METASENRGLTKPLAAYRLGLLSRTYAKWSALFRDKPEYEWGTAEGVMLSITQVTEAALHLAAEIPANLYGELKAWLKDQGERWASVVDMVWRVHVDEGPWNEQVYAGTRADGAAGLVLTMNLISETLLGLKGWFDLGAAVGEYQARLDALEVSSSPPEITDIVAIARALSPATKNLPPILAKMLHEGSEPPPQSPRAFLTRVLAPVGDHFDSKSFGPEFDLFVIQRLLFDLDEAIQAGLRNTASPQNACLPERTESAVPLTPQHEARSDDRADTAEVSLQKESTEHLKPRWEEKSRDGCWVGRLWLGTKLARSVRHGATNIVAVLRAFERKGWPERILDPLSTDREDSICSTLQQRRHETIRSLNENLKHMEFCGCGDDRSIGWKQQIAPQDLPANSQTSPRHLP